MPITVAQSHSEDRCLPWQARHGMVRRSVIWPYSVSVGEKGRCGLCAFEQYATLRWKVIRMPGPSRRRAGPVCCRTDARLAAYKTSNQALRLCTAQITASPKEAYVPVLAGTQFHSLSGGFCAVCVVVLGHGSDAAERWPSWKRHRVAAVGNVWRCGVVAVGIPVAPLCAPWGRALFSLACPAPLASACLDCIAHFFELVAVFDDGNPSCLVAAGYLARPGADSGVDDELFSLWFDAPRHPPRHATLDQAERLAEPAPHLPRYAPCSPQHRSAR